MIGVKKSFRKKITPISRDLGSWKNPFWLPESGKYVFYFQIPLRPTINFISPGCRFRLELICEQVVALCNCPSHVVAFNLSSFRNIFTNLRCLLDLDTTMQLTTAPPCGKDYVVHFKNAKNSFFGQLGSWFRIWCDKGASRCEKWHFTPNHKIHLPKERLQNCNPALADKPRESYQKIRAL